MSANPFSRRQPLLTPFWSASQPILRAVSFAATLALFLASQASAGLVAYEGFNYPPDETLLGKGGGSGWMGNWSNSYGTAPSTASGSLSFGSLTTSGGRVVTTVGGGTRRNLSTSFTDGSTFYASFLLRRDAEVTNSYGGFDFGADGNGIFVGDGGNVLLVGRSSTSFSTSSGVTTGEDITHFLVVKVQLVAGLDTVTLYVNPTPGGTEPLSGTVFNTFDFGTIGDIRTNIGSTLNVDELRIGTAYADVTPVPEPAGAILVTSGIGAMAIRRRRRVIAGKFR